MSWIANVVIGVVGSILGYWLAGLVAISAEGGVVHFVIAVACAALLIFILCVLVIFPKG